MTNNQDVLHVMFGSRTGNSRSAAVLAHEYAKFLGLRSELIDMYDFHPENIENITNMLITVSTHGEGDPPLAAEKLLLYLADVTAPQMERRKFSILALGDSSYRHFCKTGHDFRDNLIRLGADEVYALQECDIDFEEGAKSWVEGAVNAFRNILPGVSTENNQSFTFELMAAGDASGDTYMARIIEKEILNEGNPLKQTMLVKLSLKNSGIAFEAGDTIGVSAFNSRRLVDELIRRKGWDPTHVLKEKGVKEMLKQVLISDYELTLLTPLVLKKYAVLARNPELDRILQDEKLLSDYCDTRDVVDMLTDFSTEMNIGDLFTVLRKLSPRLYSVASSPKKDPDSVDLLVGIISTQEEDRVYEGVCSSFLSGRLEVGESVGIHLEKNEKFRLPDAGLPCIMIGAGTGIAPFRAFLQERELTQATGANWLFFGEQFSTTDFFFRKEMEAYLENGLLSRLDVAFSRDQAEKVYVTHRMLESSKELFLWIKEGAVVYLSGNKRKLAVNVRRTLKTILEKEGHMTSDKAAAYLEKMKAEKQYREDVY